MHISSLILCALPFLETDYKAPTRFDILVMALAAVTATFVTVDILKQKTASQ